MSADFYVGYRTAPPPRLQRWLRTLAIFLVVAAVSLAGALAWVQQDFGAGLFEFGVERDFEGVLLLSPYPLLQVTRPGSPVPSLFLLTRFGKHALELDPQLDGRTVALRGSLIARGRRTMIEVTPGSVVDRGAASAIRPEVLGRLVVAGEIVDSKCWLGVMKPNQGTSHRACATLCLRGGVPPMLRVASDSGRSEVLLLVDANGGPLGQHILDRVAVPVEVSGSLSRLGADLYVLAADPADIRRVRPQSP